MTQNDSAGQPVDSASALYPSQLAQTQRRFWQLITAPSGVSEGLAMHRAEDPGIAPLSSWIRATDEAAAIARLGVYANMYFFRLLGCLQQDFPVCEQVVGQDTFSNLVTEYLLIHPPDNPSLRYLGLAFPGFLAGHAVMDTHPHVADLARVEWARIVVFDRMDQQVLSATHLQGLAPEAWPELHLQAIDACRRVEVQWAVERPWGEARLEHKKSLTPPSKATGEILVWRDGFMVHQRRVDEPAESAALSQVVGTGLSFGELCELLSGLDRELEEGDVAQLAVTLLRRWLSKGVLLLPESLT